MSYEPFTPDEKARANAYRWVWVCALGAAVVIAIKLSGNFPPFAFVLSGLAIGGVLGTFGSYRVDEFFERLCLSGLRFMAVFIASYVFFISMSGLPSFEARFGLSHSRLNDGHLIGLLAMGAYYIGYAYAWLRDRFA